MLACTDTVCELLYGSMKTTLAPEAVKICRQWMSRSSRYRM